MVELKTNLVYNNLFKLLNFKKIGRRYKSFNSAEWLKRRDDDIYIKKAQKENYRCRSAFKLIEIDDKYGLVKPGFVVLDIGAAPGSWAQVLAARTNSNGKNAAKPKGTVIAIDLSPIYPIEGVIILARQDFTSGPSQENILKALGSRKLNFVFSDMAPRATGVKSLDQAAILNLAYPVVLFAVKHLSLGGGCLFKIWEGQHEILLKEVQRFFKFVNFVKPNATYLSSSEIYVLCREFLGIKR